MHDNQQFPLMRMSKHNPPVFYLRLYECRTGLAWRLIFEAQKGVLTFDFAGDHDEVQNYLRGKR